MRAHHEAMPSSSKRRAFVLKGPRSGRSPIVFDSPHSGSVFPRDFRPAASRAEIRGTCDAYVEELCAGVVESGAVLLAARFPRAYIDANRAMADLDAELLAGPWPAPLAPSRHGARGMGLVWRIARPGLAMYDRRLSCAEVARRIRHYYRPYRRALCDALDAAWREHGAVWHFNCHSMKSRGGAGDRRRPVARADFVIGDRGGTTAPPELTAWVATFFSSRGYSVEINHPYPGADIVRAHGEPARRRFSLQIEINRALYLNEATGVRTGRFAQVQRLLAAFARAIAVHARGELARRGWSGRRGGD